jgi:ubiquinone/menaquinone biosynthesis C-methylase UbiE
VVQGYDRSTYGDRFADVYDEWYEGITDAEAVAEVVAAVAAEVGGGAGSAVLELGVGTGRLALPIADRGIDVVGVDASEAMLAQLERKVAERGSEALGSVRSVLGDMADPPVADERFAVALVAYNTLFNLVDDGAQARCLAAVAALLEPGGSLLVEAFVPDLDRQASSVEPRTITADRVVLSVSRADPVRQEALGQYVDITEQGISLRPWHIRWATPEQLDAMAADAGLELVERWSGWDRTAFEPGDPTHIVRYRRVVGDP